MNKFLILLVLVLSFIGCDDNNVTRHNDSDIEVADIDMDMDIDTDADTDVIKDYCEYADVTYDEGDTFKDKCNDCECVRSGDELVVVCTEMACCESPGEVTETHTCPDGSKVTWCTCDENYISQCIDSPENLCEQSDDDFTEPDEDSVILDEDSEIPDEDCVEAGGTFGIYPGAPSCCSGLQPVSTEEIYYDDSNRGYCQQLTGASVCIVCGDGTCGAGEDICTCPADCSETRDTSCDDGGEVLCDLMQPDDCEGSLILAIANNCWSCVDPLTCKTTDRDPSCDDGTIPTCNMMPPECAKTEILAYVNDCYLCVNPETCLEN